MENKILLIRRKNNKKLYNFKNFYRTKNIKNNKKKKVKHIEFEVNFLFNRKYIGKLIFFIFLILLFISFSFKKKTKNINSKKSYFACFSGMGKRENKYVRELIEYYSKLGVEKFIFGDNNLLNDEKLSDVIQDYIDDGTVDIIELFGSNLGQSALNNITYERYNNQCKWLLFFDFDEYLEVHFEKNKNLILQDFLTNEIFNKCEAILFNWVMYSDNNLIHYDNRPLSERFTEPLFEFEANKFVKSIVRGNLNKTIFVDGQSNHVPVEGVIICDSMGRLFDNYDPYAIEPPIFDNGYLKHYSYKTAEEYCDKILKGKPGGIPHDIYERIQLFFDLNKFSEEKLKIFENFFNRTFGSFSHRIGGD